MSRTTIDYGIDLGTTNSTIALVDGTTTEVIRNNLDSETTPSAVYVDGENKLWVGQMARSKVADERAEEDVFLEFKRRMGTGFQYALRASGRHMSPEQLSAEVLKSLRSDVAQRKGEEISAAVLTVPAFALAGSAPAPIRVAGDVRVAFLGELPRALDPTASWEVWRVTVGGRVQVPGAGPGGTYQQTRQAYVVTPRGQGGAAPILRAWRVVR